ncbi:MAG: hypothetical protein LAP85_00830 [Acidobacteriia bacterium]|nr:hypothetical protein [Terriglobia bacterium]
MFTALLSLLILQRILELVLAERNLRWIVARGGKEWGRRGYPVIVAVHTLFYISLALEWHYRSRGWNSAWPLWLGLLLSAQLLRLWAIRTLGRYWNTRVIAVPGMQPVAEGPYRFIRHPNYVAVITEMLTIPVLCGAYFTAAVFSLANALVLAQRIPEEERALEQASGAPLRYLPRFFPARTRKP